MKKKLIALSGAALGFAPLLALAQVGITGATSACTNAQNINAILCKIGQILNAIVPLLIALGVVYFVWGVISFVIAGDEEAKTKGRDRMIFGIIGLAVIIGLWGLVKIVTNTFGLNNTTTIELPTVPVIPN